MAEKDPRTLSFSNYPLKTDIASPNEALRAMLRTYSCFAARPSTASANNRETS